MADPITPPAGDPPANPPPSNEDELSKLSVNELVTIVRGERRTAAGYRSRVTALENEKKALDAELSTLRSDKQKREDDDAKAKGDYEKVAKDAEKRAAEAQAKADAQATEFATYRKRETVRTEAIKAGIVNPADVDFLDVSKLPDDPTQLATAAAELVTKTKTDRANWFAAAPPQPNHNNPAPQPAPPFGFGTPPPLPQPGPVPAGPINLDGMSAEARAAEVRRLDAQFGFVS